MCSSSAYVALMVIYSIIEFWFGKTKRTRANSVIEFVAIVVSTFILKLWKGNENGQR